MSNVVPFARRPPQPKILEPEHTRIKMNWHVAKLPGVAFFGYSQTEVVGRARKWQREHVAAAYAYQLVQASTGGPRC